MYLFNRLIAMKNIPFQSFLICFCMILCLQSCENSDKESIKEYTLKLLTDKYLWYQNIVNTDPDLNSNPKDYFYSLLYREIDHWSFMITIDEYRNHFIDPKYIGHGFRLSESDGKLRIAFVFQSTSAYKQGVRRGWEIISINNKPYAGNDSYRDDMGGSVVGLSNTFLFRDETGNDRLLTLVKEEIHEYMVLRADTFNYENHIVGNLVLQSFTGTINSELDSAFGFFKTSGVNELVVDLRYNGGGYLSSSEKLASLIAGTNVHSKIFQIQEFNDKYKHYNDSSKFEEYLNSLNLNRVFFITSGNTYSASESTINALEPYIEVYTIGEPTGGKPVGMVIYSYDEYVLAPISFKLANSNGYGDYFNGLPVDALIGDDLTHDWGRGEASFDVAIQYLVNGYFVSTKSPRTHVPIGKSKINAYEALKYNKF